MRVHVRAFILGGGGGGGGTHNIDFYDKIIFNYHYIIKYAPYLFFWHYSTRPEDQWSCKRSPDYFPGIATTVKEKKGNIDILDAQEQLTRWSLIRSGQISKSSKLLGFFHLLREANSAGSGQIWPNYELL